MMVKIGTGRRITIPKDLLEETDFKEGDILDIQYVNNSFVLTKPISNNTIINCPSNKENEDTTKDNKEVIQINTQGKNRKIVSNLDTGCFYSTKYYSECGLVIRTKRRYLKEFCSDCKGQLLKQDYVDNHKCPYVYNVEEETNKLQQATKQEKKKVSNKLIEQLANNANEVYKIIDNAIDNINKLDPENNKPEKEDTTKEQKSNKKYIDDEDYVIEKQKRRTKITPIKINKGFRRCCGCDSFVDSGFRINSDFYCKKCAAEDFKNYVKLVKKIKDNS